MLDRLATDPDDNVVEAAVDGLKSRRPSGDARFISALTRRGYQVVRAAARALEGAEPSADAIPALNAALHRLSAEGHDNSTDARTRSWQRSTARRAGQAAASEADRRVRF